LIFNITSTADDKRRSKVGQGKRRAAQDPGVRDIFACIFLALRFFVMYVGLFVCAVGLCVTLISSGRR
jgi:hypothetical protein